MSSAIIAPTGRRRAPRRRAVVQSGSAAPPTSQAKPSSSASAGAGESHVGARSAAKRALDRPDRRAVIDAIEPRLASASSHVDFAPPAVGVDQVVREATEPRRGRRPDRARAMAASERGGAGRCSIRWRAARGSARGQAVTPSGARGEASLQAGDEGAGSIGTTVSRTRADESTPGKPAPGWVPAPTR